MMKGLGGSVVYVKINPKALKGLFDLAMVLIDDGLRCGPLLFRSQSYGSSVFITSTHPKHIIPPHAQIPDKNIGR